MKPPPVARVLAVLPAEAWATDEYIAERAGLKVTTVRRLLSGLRSGGLAWQQGTTWRRRVVEQPNNQPAADAVGKE